MHRNLVLPVQDFDLILDVVDQQIVCVEILDRPDLKLLLDDNFRACLTEEKKDGESGRREVLTPAPHTTGHTDP